MASELDKDIATGLRKFAERKATFVDLCRCVKKIPDLIQVISNEKFASYLRGLDDALERKGYGNVRSSDAPEPVPYGLRTEEGLFFPYAFTSSETAHAFAAASGAVKEGGAYPSIVKSTPSVLHACLLKKYGGIIIDEGSDHRLVLDRKTTASLYAQLTLELLAAQPEIFVLLKNGRPLLRATAEKKTVAYCFDSIETANAGLALIKKTAGTASDTLTIGSRGVNDALKLTGSADFVAVNKGLPDERYYSRTDIDKLIALSEVMSKGVSSIERKDRYDEPPPDNVVLVPTGEAPFLRMWKGLTDLTQLFLPLERNLTPENRCVVEVENMLEVANLLNKTPEGMQVGLVFTDRKVFVPGACYASMNASECLKQYFHAGRVGAVDFNSSLNRADMNSLNEDITYRLPRGYTLYRFVLPRLIGLMVSDDPFAVRSGSHIRLAEQAASADNPYSAYHHAAAAREEGAALNDYYFFELGALMTLNLNKQVSDYLQWYQNKKGQDPRFRLYYARALTLSGQPDQALPLVQTFLQDRSLGGFAWLERGRAYMIKGMFQEAITSFDECLRLDPGNLDACLGAGIAYRNINYSSGNREGLAAARSCFEKVASPGGYHASEAYFHIGTILLAVGDYAGCETATLKSLRLRDTGIARRNLILSLHAQGKVKEASDQYTFLKGYSPKDAEGLEKYFS
jgi:tetratricopeptide (TPR) repeat protein